MAQGNFGFVRRERLRATLASFGANGLATLWLCSAQFTGNTIGFVRRDPLVTGLASFGAADVEQDWLRSARIMRSIVGFVRQRRRRRKIGFVRSPRSTSTLLSFGAKLRRSLASLGVGMTPRTLCVRFDQGVMNRFSIEHRRIVDDVRSEGRGTTWRGCDFTLSKNQRSLSDFGSRSSWKSVGAHATRNPRC